MAEGFAKLAKLLAFDTVCLLLVVGFSLFLKVAISPPKWGFSCDDIRIMHPNKPSTVSNMNLYLATVVVPTAGILTMEARRLGGEGKARLVEGLEVPLWLVSAYREAGSFLYGAAVTEAITELTKVATGKLRPHFLQACRPEPGCDGLLGKPKFIRGGEYRCKNKKDNDEMRKSFLSGHSSISLFSMVFLAFYLERHPPLLGQDSPLVTPTCQAGLICFGWAVSLSRYSDFKHDLLDIISGAILGSIIAVFTTFRVRGLPAKGEADNFLKKYTKVS